MKALMAGLIWLGSSFAFAQAPDPRDSIILESKTVHPGAHSGSATDTAAFVYLKVYITNKDTLTAIALSLQESSVTGGAYMTLGWPRTFNGVVSLFTTTLNDTKILFGGRYNSTSPDSFLIEGVFDQLNPATLEPPNSVRKAFWEIKFDTVFNNGGTVELDTAMVIQSTGFVNNFPADIRPNFVKGTITVDPHPRGDLNYDFSLSPADVVSVLYCVMLGTIPLAGRAACDLNCDGQASPADVMLELNAVYLAEALPC